MRNFYCSTDHIINQFIYPGIEPLVWIHRIIYKSVNDIFLTICREFINIQAKTNKVLFGWCMVDF